MGLKYEFFPGFGVVMVCGGIVLNMVAWSDGSEMTTFAGDYRLNH